MSGRGRSCCGPETQQIILIGISQLAPMVECSGAAPLLYPCLSVCGLGKRKVFSRCVAFARTCALVYAAPMTRYHSLASCNSSQNESRSTCRSASPTSGSCGNKKETISLPISAVSVSGGRIGYGPGSPYPRIHDCDLDRRGKLLNGCKWRPARAT